LNFTGGRGIEGYRVLWYDDVGEVGLLRVDRERGRVRGERYAR
jgi:hypothetical protein